MNTSIEFASAKKKATSVDALRQRLSNAQTEVIEASKNNQSELVMKLIAEIHSIQNNLELAQLSDKETDIYLLKMNELKKLFNQPLGHFNDIVFRSLVEKVIVQAENGKPTALKLILTFGSEITESLA